MQGPDVLKCIRASATDSKPPKIPVFVITAHTVAEWAERCADLAVDGYVKKPFDPFDLLHRVKAQLWGGEEEGHGGSAQSGRGFMEGLSAPVRESVRFISNHYEEFLRTRDIAAHPRVFRSRKHLGRQFKKKRGKP